MAESECINLQIALHRLGLEVGSYLVELRCQHDGVEDSCQGQAVFSFEALREHLLDMREYGTLLGRSLFGDEAIRSFFDRVSGLALRANRVGPADPAPAVTEQAPRQRPPLRLQLCVGHTAPELHALRWEALRDPASGEFIPHSEGTLFCRYLSSRTVRTPPPAPPRPRALIVVASPSDLVDAAGQPRYQPGGHPLLPLPVDAEVERAQLALGEIECRVLASDGTATLDNICDYVRDGYDILYLVCHGAMRTDEHVLWLEHPDRTQDRVPAQRLAERLGALPQQPRLVVLAACESAGGGQGTADESTRVALGPQLIEAGVPAVLAMQGQVSLAAVAEFMPVFFRELRRDWQIDRAVAAARAAVDQGRDWWAPVLFSRLRDGRLSGPTPGERAQPAFEPWHALTMDLREENYTLVVGPGLVEPLLGSWRGIALRWAELHDFPLARYGLDDLAQVAQYLVSNQGNRRYPRQLLADHLRGELLRRYPSELHVAFDGAADRASLEQLIQAVGKSCREDPHELHRLLAKLPVQVYLTSSPFDLLTDALVEAGKEPRVGYFRWTGDIDEDDGEDEDDGPTRSAYALEEELEPGYRPDVQHPLVYHLFGHTSRPSSVVLTQDDHLDYLMALTRHFAQDDIPPQVRKALARKALLFAGFRLEDRSFRVLFRLLASKGITPRADRYTNVAVQLEPEEGRTLRPDRARRYLEQYLREKNIYVYWGNVSEFLNELTERLRGEPRSGVGG